MPFAERIRTLNAWLEARPRRARALGHGLVLLGFWLLAGAYLWPLPQHLNTQFVDEGVGDPIFAVRCFRHIFGVLAGREAGGLYDVDFFWPHPGALASTDSAIGADVLSWPLTLFARNEVGVYNLGIWATYAFTGHAAWVVSRRLTGSSAVGLVVGVLTAFSANRASNLDHYNLVQTQGFLYLLAAAMVLREKPSLPRAGLLSATLVLQFSLSMNLALYQPVGVALVLLWAIAGAPVGSRRKALGLVVLACLAAAPVLWPAWRPYLLAQEAWSMTRDATKLDEYHYQLESWFHRPGLTKTGALEQDGEAFLGVVTYAFGLLGLLALRAGRLEVEPIRRWVKWGVPGALMALGVGGLWSSQAAAILVFLLALLAMRSALLGRLSEGLLLAMLSAGVFGMFVSLGFEVRYGDWQVNPAHPSFMRLGAGLWATVSALPGWSSVRTPLRFFCMVSLLAPQVAGVGLWWLGEGLKSRPRLRLGTFGLVGLVGLVDLWRGPMPLWVPPAQEPPTPAYAWLRAHPGPGAVLELPLHFSLERSRMFRGMVTGRPLVNAESGLRLPVASWVADKMFWVDQGWQGLERLRGAGVEYVLIQPQHSHEPLAKHYREQLKRVGAGRVAVFDPDELWRIPPPEHVVPLAPDKALMRVVIQPENLPGKPVQAMLVMVTTGNWFVFERRFRRFTLEVTGPGGTTRRRIALAPPLLSPSASWAETIDLSLQLPDGHSQVGWKLTDDTGQVWDEGQSEVAMGASLARLRRGGAPRCELRLVSASRLPDGHARLAVEVTNTGTEAWTGGHTLELQGLPRAEDLAEGESRLVQDRGTLLPVGPGMRILDHVEVMGPAGTQMVVQAVRMQSLPGEPPVACSLTAALP
jgi:hypothetical protein